MFKPRDRRHRSPGRGWLVRRRARSPRSPAPRTSFSLAARSSIMPRSFPPSASKYKRVVETERYDVPRRRDLPRGPTNVTTGWPPTSRWRWLWSPRCSIRVTVCRHAAAAPGRSSDARCARPRFARPRGVPAKSAAGRRLIVGCPSRAANVGVDRVLVDFPRRTDLYQPSSLDHADPRCHRHRFRLIVG